MKLIQRLILCSIVLSSVYVLPVLADGGVQLICPQGEVESLLCRQFERSKPEAVNSNGKRFVLEMPLSILICQNMRQQTFSMTYESEHSVSQPLPTTVRSYENSVTYLSKQFNTQTNEQMAWKLSYRKEYVPGKPNAAVSALLGAVQKQTTTSRPMSCVEP